MSATIAQQRRRTYLEMALRRIQPGTGSSPEFYRRRDWTETPVDLSGIKTPFLVIGAVATRLYMPERVTRDIDLLVHRDQAHSLYRELNDLGLKQSGALSIGGSTWSDEFGFEVDVVESSESWVPEALKRPNRSPDGLPVAALPFLVILKLNASRSVDFGDLGRMLGLASDAELDDVRRAFATYQPADLEDLESLITLGAIEFGRPNE